MSKSMGAASIMLGALLLAGCNTDTRTTCYGTEPDGEVEKLRPCPPGWKNGENRIIGEDQYKSFEVVDLNEIKGKAVKTSAVKVKPTKTK